MELKEFVSETLIQIIDGVVIAQKHAIANGALINPTSRQKNLRADNAKNNYPAEQTVEFDVAISISDLKEGKTGAGIFVAPFSLGAEVKGGAANQTISRIKFPVPLFLPEQKNSKEY